MPPPVIPFSTNVGTFIEQTTKPRLQSPIAWGISVGATSTQIVGQNLVRRGLTISNVGVANIYICPAIDGNGDPLAAGGAGSLILTPGQWISFGQESQCTVAWNASGPAGSNPVTVWEFY